VGNGAAEGHSESGTRALPYGTLDQACATGGAVIEIEHDSERVRSERTRELFLGALGHDLRGPLHAMSIGSEMLLETPDLGPDERRTLERMRTSIRRMNRLIEQTLLLAQSMVEGVPLERRATDLRKVLATVISEVGLRHGDRAIQLSAPPAVVGVRDADRLVQVVDNLVGNALKYGEGTIRIELAGV
jgi:signal transduction histidine kinase